MRKIKVLTFLSLDGVMQAPGGPKEDPSGDFKFGGWTVPFFEEVAGSIMGQQMAEPYELLLGKKTYDIFAAYWPNQPDENPPAKTFNKVTKYVASHEPFDSTWANTKILTGDVVSQLKKLKSEDGPDLQVHGSGNFIQTLLKNDLVDEMWLKIFPVTLGSGKKLFAEGTIPATFELIDSKITPLGVIFANYKRTGEIKTGTF